MERSNGAAQTNEELLANAEQMLIRGRNNYGRRDNGNNYSLAAA